jgi:glycosyltransferase involved in cell wall biosynthesis
MSKKIKVLHIVTRLELGGAQQNTLYTVQHLDPGRFETVLFCGRGGLLDDAVLGGSVRTIFVPGLVRPIRPWSDLRALGAMVRLLRAERPEIVHTHSSKAGVLGRIAARLAGVPVVVHTFHGFGFHSEQAPFVRRLFVGIERRLARWTTALVAVSRANRDEALGLGIGGIHQYRLIRSGVSLETYLSIKRPAETPPGLSFAPADRVIATIGPFKPQKNLLDFVRAAERVAARRPEARFLVVGDGEGRDRLEREIRRANLRDRFVLAGWRRDIPALLARTDIFCLTSLWEGLPRSLVEAMAAGLPCVANAVDGCRDLIQDGVNGFLAPPKRPLVTADRLIQILEDEALARRLGESARVSIGREFDIDVMVAEQEKLYEALLERNVQKEVPGRARADLG